MSDINSGVSTADVIAAYRLILGREPSANEAAAWLGTRSLQDLSGAFLSSEEFCAKQGKPFPGRQRLPDNLPALDVEWQTDAASSSRLLAHVKKTWTAMGQSRPHWSVLSSDRFLPERIDENASSFFMSGASELAVVKSAMQRHGLKSDAHVFEYGCGIGRVTAHLADAFQRVTACDISTSHLEIARQVVSDRTNVAFLLVENDQFAMTEPFDVWCSYIVLQHNPPPIMAMILSKMFRTLAVGGVAIFQVPTYCIGYRFRVAEYLAGGAADGAIEVHCLPQPVVFALAHQAGCVPLEVLEDVAMGPPSHWLSNTFIFRKAVASRPAAGVGARVAGILRSRFLRPRIAVRSGG